MSNEEKERFIELRASGKSYEIISKEMNRSKQTLINWAKEYEHEIQNLQSVNDEAMLERLQLSQRARIHNLALILEKIRNEIDARSLESIPTIKLYELYLKYIGEIKGETLNPVFASSTLINELRNSSPF
jgi:transposase-like protein